MPAARWAGEAAPDLAAGTHGRGRVAGGSGRSVVEPVPVKEQVQAGRRASLQDGYGLAELPGRQRDRRVERGAASDFVGLGVAAGDQRLELGTPRQHKVPEDRPGIAPSALGTQARVEAAKGMGVAAEQQIVDRREQQVGSPLGSLGCRKQAEDLGIAGRRQGEPLVQGQGSPALLLAEVPESLGQGLLFVFAHFPVATPACPGGTAALGRLPR